MPICKRKDIQFSSEINYSIFSFQILMLMLNVEAIPGTIGPHSHKPRVPHRPPATHKFFFCIILSTHVTGVLTLGTCAQRRVRKAEKFLWMWCLMSASVWSLIDQIHNACLWTVLSVLVVSVPWLLIEFIVCDVWCLMQGLCRGSESFFVTLM